MNKPFIINHMTPLLKEDFSSFSAFDRAISSNTGNPYITYSLVKELYNWEVPIEGIQNIWEFDFKETEKIVERINNNYSHVFLQLQDHIRPAECQWDLPYKELTLLLEKIERPIFLFGIGCNAKRYDKKIYERISGDFVRLLKVVSERTGSIGVRGEVSAEILSKLSISNYDVIGCPSLYENGPFNKIHKTNTITFEDIVFTSPYTVSDFGNQPVILQSEAEIIKALIENPRAMMCHYRHKNLFRAFLNENFKIYGNIVAWKKLLSQYKFAIGARFHGGVIAVNSGVPAVVINNDLRSFEICDFIKIPRRPDWEHTPALDVFKYLDYEPYNKHYEFNFKNYRTFLQKNGLDFHKKFCERLNINKDDSNFGCNFETLTITKSQKSAFPIPSDTISKDRIEPNEKSDPSLNYLKQLGSLYRAEGNIVNSAIDKTNFKYWIKNNFFKNSKLEVFVLTYNRLKYLKRTFGYLFSYDSPLSGDIKITVLDNCSTDGTSEYLDTLRQDHPNLNVVRHNKNIGGNANIIEAFKRAEEEYFWILCDDDTYDWTSWVEVIEAMEKKYDAIVVSRNLPKPDIDESNVINELGFVPAGIYRTELITSEVLQNAYVNIYNSFPHLALVCSIVNESKSVYITEKVIVKQGFELKRDPKQYVRGLSNYVHPRQSHLNLLLSYVNSYQLIKDNNLRYKCNEKLFLGRSFLYSTYVFLNKITIIYPMFLNFLDYYPISKDFGI